MSRIGNVKLRRLQAQLLARVNEFGLMPYGAYAHDTIPVLRGESYLYLRTTNQRVWVEEPDGTAVMEFSPTRPDPIFRWLRDMKERLDAQRLSETLE